MRHNADNYATEGRRSAAVRLSVTSYGYDTAGDLTSRSVADGSTSLVTG